MSFTARASASVNFFSIVNDIFGHCDRKNAFSLVEMNDFRGDLGDISRKTATLISFCADTKDGGGQGARPTHQSSVARGTDHLRLWPVGSQKERRLHRLLHDELQFKSATHVRRRSTVRPTNSAFILAQTSVKSPRKLFTVIM